MEIAGILVVVWLESALLGCRRSWSPSRTTSRSRTIYEAVAGGNAAEIAAAWLTSRLSANRRGVILRQVACRAPGGGRVLFTRLLTAVGVAQAVVRSAWGTAIPLFRVVAPLDSIACTLLVR